ncbi:cupin domain-containing protein [Candidatus Oscillochloris fontis]|uniref:cupin domain-containing protein n=1 Tax=Candidatus Oscillochloris fontis TaxID=2496868 RepID=UPI00101D5B13|nr:cupin domain-containing protein [Candidatus Oscillochloris fontis]
MGLPAELIINIGDVLQRVQHNGPATSINSEQLNVNLLHLSEGASIPQHTNEELDVLFVVIQGTCKLFVDNQTTVLRTGMAAVVPAGRVRALRCTMGPLVYLTCHRRRGPLMPKIPERN